MFLLAAQKHAPAISTLNSRLDSLDIPVTSEMLGTIIWPYIHNEWDVASKFDAIATHYETLSDYPKLSQISKIKQLQICDFSQASPAITIVIDYAKWFTREGELVINVFQANLRVASMAFTLAREGGNSIAAYVGAVQGIHGGVSAEESLDIYKILTKDFFGLRPRSLLLEVLKVVASKLGATKLFGVSEQNRHHRHQYFGNDQNTTFKNNYNSFWEEHNGLLNSETGFYEISMKPAIRDISEIAAKKRGQYRRRYEFIASIDGAVNLIQHSEA